MIVIDTQIWIYLLEPNARENENVRKYLEGNKDDGILITEKIGLNPIIPIEVAHNLFGNSKLNTNNLHNALVEIFNAENISIFDINQNIMSKALGILKNYRGKGIGGRDSLILATMVQENISTIITHDKNILSLSELNRIDPVFNPPLKLEIDDTFDFTNFKKMVKI